MSRAFAFKTPAQKEARLRQLGCCAVCGDSLDDVVEHAHHVIPNQSGQRGNPGHVWLSSADNCVILCDMCHEQVHEGGKYKTGGVAPPSYFEHSHGKKGAAHRRWAALMDARARSIWR